MSKPLLILSGGLDSAVALWMLKPNVRCLTFDYGQRHDKEIGRARVLSEIAKVPHEVANISSLRPLISKGSVSGRDSVPEGHYAEESMKSTVSPNRNMIMISIAVAHAISVGCDKVVFGAHAGDHAIYPDCRGMFVEAMENAILLGNWDQVFLDAPFLHLSKADIVVKGSQLGVPFHLTWSCYNGRTLPCGKCGTCVERLEAFHLAGLADPLTYEDREWWRTQIKEEPKDA